MKSLREMLLDSYIETSGQPTGQPLLYLKGFVEGDDRLSSGIIPGTNITLQLISICDNRGFEENGFSYIWGEFVNNAVSAYGEWTEGGFAPYDGVEQGIVRVTMFNRGCDYSVYVRDYGVGMDEAIVRNVLAREHETTQKSGHGMGFPLVFRDLRNKYNGRLSLMSRGKFYVFGQNESGRCYTEPIVESVEDIDIGKGSLFVAEFQNGC